MDQEQQMNYLKLAEYKCELARSKTSSGQDYQYSDFGHRSNVTRPMDNITYPYQQLDRNATSGKIWL